jgi:hypothetical protein
MRGCRKNKRSTLCVLHHCWLQGSPLGITEGNPMHLNNRYLPYLECEFCPSDFHNELSCVLHHGWLQGSLMGIMSKANNPSLSATSADGAHFARRIIVLTVFRFQLEISFV